MQTNFLPISKDDLKARGWSELDVILVSGDAYVDHPSYAAAIIGRVLESEGFKVGIIAQPDWKNTIDFKRLGRPKLFFGVTAGNLDSMIANYTANKMPRSSDDYSPGGKAGCRPDRTSLVYCNKIREAFPGVSIVLGGIEASMRRLAHYDYWSDKVKHSILLDSKADMLIYGMGEKQIFEIARRMREGETLKAIDNVRGTVIVRNDISGLNDGIEIPSYEEVSASKDKFNEAFRKFYLEADPVRGHTIVQKHDKRYVVQLPPAKPLSTDEMDRIYSLNYAHAWHPSYSDKGGVPGFETVKNSIVSHRGCSGGCSFCTLFLHQGRMIQSRSEESILEEVKRLAARPDFGGTITDIGGPTANLYMAHCGQWDKAGACRDRRCLVPEKCKNLQLGYDNACRLWKRVMAVPGVKHLFIGSGLRYDLLVDNYSDKYLKDLCREHVSGQLKVAPEHSREDVLRLMGKPSFHVYEKFASKFDRMNKDLHKKQYLVNYFISGHPGCDLAAALELSLYLAKHNIRPEQIQDYIPLPMTLSAAMFYTGKDPMNGRRVCVDRNIRDRKLQRALIQSKQPANRRYVLEALKKLNRMDLARKLLP
jgi:uncharacterized radical SAM protein YgiQ